MGDGRSVIVMSNRNGILCGRRDEKIGSIRMGGSSPSKHAIFLYYSRIAERLNDAKWKNFFEIMSRGNFWKGLKFDGTQLISKKKNTIKTHLVMVSGDMDIDNDFDEDLQHYNECKEFIKINSSHSALKETEESLALVVNTDPIKSGFENSISKQAMYINEFAMRMSRTFSLSDRIKECIVSSIFAKLSNKSLIPKTSFIFNEMGFIDRIKGLQIDVSGYEFDDSVSAPQVKKQTSEPSEGNVDQKRYTFKCSKNLTICMKKTPQWHQ